MRKLVGAVSHHEREIEELREDREYAVALLRVALESLDKPEERAGGLLALRAVAEARGIAIIEDVKPWLAGHGKSSRPKEGITAPLH